jgi:hypothetical protein
MTKPAATTFRLTEADKRLEADLTALLEEFGCRPSRAQLHRMGIRKLAEGLAYLVKKYDDAVLEAAVKDYVNGRLWRDVEISYER